MLCLLFNVLHVELPVHFLLIASMITHRRSRRIQNKTTDSCARGANFKRFSSFFVEISITRPKLILLPIPITNEGKTNFFSFWDIKTLDQFLNLAHRVLSLQPWLGRWPRWFHECERYYKRNYSRILMNKIASISIRSLGHDSSVCQGLVLNIVLKLQDTFLYLSETFTFSYGTFKLLFKGPVENLFSVLY